MTEVTLKNISKVYDSETKAVKDVSFSVNPGEFIVLVGPSGCGKSTILRMIAGLEEITDGELYFDNDKMNKIPAGKRDVGMVFQNYALYPHMTVAENLAFPLKIKKMKKELINSRVEETAELVNIKELLKRFPKQLSGGQRQRVALARAIIREPKVFLFDEPLSNLDAKLRTMMRNEIISLQKRVGITAIYVTHDQVEAMTMGDRIIVLNEGEIQQIDTPHNIYNNPANIFTASFIGSPQMNFFDTDSELFKKSGINLEDKVKTVGVRPEDIEIDEYGFEIKITHKESLGHETLIFFKINNELKVIRLNTYIEYNTDDIIRVKFNNEKLKKFDKEGNLI